MFLVLLINVSVYPPDSSKNTEQICIKLSPEVFFGLENINVITMWMKIYNTIELHGLVVKYYFI